jgi:copper chaperone CopZ
MMMSFPVSGCIETTESPDNVSAEAVNPTTFNIQGAPTVEFSVPDMMCPDSCAVKTKEILAEQPGAKDVRVDFEAKTATVVIEDGEFDADAALAALVDHGFDQSALKGDAGAKPQAAEEAAIQ